jgi:hypothetical protein
MLGFLKAAQSPAPRWLELADTLGWNPGQPDLSEAILQKVHALPPPRRGKKPLLFALAAVMAILCGIAAFIQVQPQIRILHASHPPGPEWQPGHSLRTRRVTPSQGILKFQLSSGVQLTLEGAADIELLSPMEVRLRNGKITVDVGEHGKGFVLETPETRILDLGTVFGVDASETSKTDVVVFKGQVQVREIDPASPVRILNQGEGLSVRKNRRTSRILNVTDALQSWSAGPPPGSLIPAVTDSMSTTDEGAERWPSLKNFYRIAPKGLRDGAPAFSDSDDTWSAVPTELQGADQVRTFSVDGFNWWMKLTVELSRPCVFYIFVDQRNAAPRWVTESFSDTGKSIQLDLRPPQAKGRVTHHIPYRIWQRTIDKPGSVTVGPPYENPPSDRKSFHPNRMFGIAAKPVP